jgi:hypothetical protein
VSVNASALFKRESTLMASVAGAVVSTACWSDLLPPQAVRRRDVAIAKKIVDFIDIYLLNE